MHGLQHVNTWYKPFMSVKNDKQLQMRASEGFIRTIDDWRRHQSDIPPRAEAIRRLIRMGLAVDVAITTLRASLNGDTPLDEKALYDSLVVAKWYEDIEDSQNTQEKDPPPRG